MIDITKLSWFQVAMYAVIRPVLYTFGGAIVSEVIDPDGNLVFEFTAPGSGDRSKIVISR